MQHPPPREVRTNPFSPPFYFLDGRLCRFLCLLLPLFLAQRLCSVKMTLSFPTVIAGVLSACARWVQDFHTWARAMGHFRAALAARYCVAGPGGFLHHGRYRPRRGTLRFFQ